MNILKNSVWNLTVSSVPSPLDPKPCLTRQTLHFQQLQHRDRHCTAIEHAMHIFLMTVDMLRRFSGRCQSTIRPLPGLPYTETPSLWPMVASLTRAWHWRPAGGENLDTGAKSLCAPQGSPSTHWKAWGKRPATSLWASISLKEMGVIIAYASWESCSD